MSASGADSSGQAPPDGGRSQSDDFSTPESQSEGSSSGLQPAPCWSKREREDALDEPRKCSKASIELPASSSLDGRQRKVLEQLVCCVDEDASVVITNPLMKDNPIVYVTKPWQSMCGFTYAEAAGRNPRITQGSRTDQNVVRALSMALSNRSACKVQFVNYRGGRPDEPFWNMLSISPVLHQGNVVFYMANLQDYSYQISKMVSLTPAQFCRAATHFQRGRRFQNLDALLRAKPAIYEADDTYSLPIVPSGAKLSLTTPQPIKRLGWNHLTLDPEHLTDRLKDALQTMGATYEQQEHSDAEGEIFLLHAKLDDVACRLTVSEDPADGTHRISVTRLAGDTFVYHEAFRQLRAHLGEACTTVSQAAVAAAAAAAPPPKRFAGLKLAPAPPPIAAVQPADTPPLCAASSSMAAPPAGS